MIIVTGGAGFIGSALIWELNNRGIDDILIVDNLGTSDKWKNLRNLNYSDYIEKNDFIDKINDDKFSNIKSILHMGACSSTTERDATYLVHNNYEYSKTLALYSVKNNVRYI